MFSSLPLCSRLTEFVQNECIPAEKQYDSHIGQFSGSSRWQLEAVPPIVQDLQRKAQQLGLWNLWLHEPLPEGLANDTVGFPLAPASPLSHQAYAPLCEIMGRSFLAAEACNCSAPDSGNMQTLLKFGTPLQQRQFLLPLLRGEARSAFLMTEPNVASSDATNIQTTLNKRVQGDKITYVLTGKKWWSTGAMDPRCRMLLVVAKMDATHVPSTLEMQQQQQTSGDTAARPHGNQTVVIIPLPHPNIKFIRPLTVFGYDDAPHGHAEVWLDGVELGEEHVLLGEGRGFEIAQDRLGPGRVHHCMRAVGLAARCYELMLERTLQRQTFGKYLHEHGSVQEQIADSASDIESARLLTMSCAQAMDQFGLRGARDKIAMIKVVVPELTLRVVDRAVQIFGGAGVCDEFPLARAFVGLRTLRIADGPDAVHKKTLAALELKKARQRMIGSKI